MKCDLYLENFSKCSTTQDAEKLKLVELASSMLPLLSKISRGGRPGLIYTNIGVRSKNTACLHREVVVCLNSLGFKLVIVDLDDSVSSAQSCSSINLAFL